MRRSFLSILSLLALISTALASPSRTSLRYNDSNLLVKRDNTLDKLADIKAIDERKPMPASNTLTAQAKKESRTKIDPKSLSGQKVVDFIKDGQPLKNNNSGALFAPMATSAEISNAKLSEATKTAALSSGKTAESCKSTDNRKPWSEATTQERQAWLAAIRCTYNKPGKFKYKDIVSKSLAEDYGYTHALLNPYLHHNPAFTVCHRALLLTWLDDLRNQCGYQGDALYLDLNNYADAGKMLTDQTLWAADALGSLTCPAHGKYVDGLTFDNIGTHGPSAAVYKYKHPLCRSTNLKWDDDEFTFEQHLESTIIKDLWKIDDYDGFRSKLELKLHNAFHACIRRDMYASTSPFDAFLFFSFHIWIDCIYWGWQEKDGGKNRLKYDGMHRGTNDPVSVNDMCPMLNLGTNWSVADVLDSREEPGCFTCSKFKPSPF